MMVFPIRRPIIQHMKVAAGLDVGPAFNVTITEYDITIAGYVTMRDHAEKVLGLSDYGVVHTSRNESFRRYTGKVNGVQLYVVSWDDKRTEGSE